ncbi:hypothetical protein MHH28_11295 [Paenibacillus sp. FSL K6-1217]|uniref:hypothetical protein n=1 Tax=Paenibacillus sp. FSL K6-1217 TaxID=2921466 RepID=UPI00324D79C7
MSPLLKNEHTQPTLEIMNWLKPSFDARIEALHDFFLSTDSQSTYSKLFKILNEEGIPNETLDQIFDIYVEGCMTMIAQSYMYGVEEVLRLKHV